MKGFTLIELLAVIVILAVIALIASPIIINVIEDSRIESAKNSTYGIIDALEYTSMSSIVDNPVGTGQYNLEDKKLVLNDKSYDVSFSGTDDVTGSVVMEDNIVSSMCLKVDGYDMYYDGLVVSNYECEDKKTLKDTLSTLPTKEVNINGKVVNKVYGDKDDRTSLNNYVWYSGNLWQVLEVNEDDIKLVTSMPITNIAYGETSDYNTSWVKKWLETEFYSVLERTDLIVEDEFCLDRVEAVTESVVQDSSYTIQKVNSHTKINNCTNKISSKVGLMTFEDYVYAYNGENPIYDKANYLSGEELEWTMSSFDDDQMWITWYNSSLEYITTTQNNFSFTKRYGHGVRPVISVKASSLVTSGDGSNNDPYVLTSEKVLKENEIISNVKVGDYIYLNEENNPNTFTTEKVTRDVSYNTTKDKVRYRVIEKTNDSIKVQRADVLRNLSSDIAISSGTLIPYYYKDTGENTTWCRYVSSEDKYYTSGCRDNNYFKPKSGTGNYNYDESENIAYFLNNADNSFYSWFSNDTKEKIVDTNFELVTGGYGKDYSNLDNNSGEGIVYPNTTNDGTVNAKVGLPSWGDMYSGNDINKHYWLINRYSGSASYASGVSSGGYASGYSAGSPWLAARPVVSLKSDSQISEGRGTMTEPYILK